MKITVYIRHNESGEVRKIPMEESIDVDVATDHPPTFIWEDGNYECDCNRHLFFCRAAGQEACAGEIPCTEGRYSVNLEDDAGRIYYREFETEKP